MSTINIATMRGDVFKFKGDSMMKASRRTVLAALGLAPVTAFATENFVPADGALKPGTVSVEAQAGALEALAQEIREGRAMVCGLDVNASLRPDAVVTHKLIVEFAYIGDKPSI